MPVSETLARIFELQGNIPKAIYVYEQLSLIFPKKKTYFASQINLLKKKKFLTMDILLSALIILSSILLSSLSLGPLCLCVKLLVSICIKFLNHCN